MKDFPKLESPFIREGKDRFVIDAVNPGYEWVFNSPDVLCVEKLHGTNVSIVMNGGQLIRLFNRLNPLTIDTLDNHQYINGIRKAYSKGRVENYTGQFFGELMGPGINKNFLNLDEPEWFPFDWLQQNMSYRSYHKYAKTFENLSNWFKNDLFSLMYKKLHGENKQPEGVIFYNQLTGEMAKLRVDMFDWHKGRRHKQ